MAQKESRSSTDTQIGIRLSQYDYELLLKLAKKSGYNNYSEYIRGVINQKPIRK